MIKKPKVAIVVDAFYPMRDGVVEVVNRYATGLMENFEVHVITIFAGKNAFDDSVLPYKVWRAKSFKIPFTQYRFPTPNYDRKLFRKLDEEKFDLFHINSPYPLGYVIAKYAKKNNIPIISSFHTQYARDIYKITRSKPITKLVVKSMMKVYNNANLCLTMSDFTKKLYSEYGGTTTCEILPNAPCLSMPKTSLDNLRAKVKEEYQLSDNLTFLFAGRITADKGIFFALDVVKKLRDDGLDFTMLFVGSGLLEKKLNRKIKKYKLQDRVKTLGLVSDKEKLLALYSIADLFIFPSVYDTDGIVKREAAFVNTPSICIKDTGAGSDIIDNENGYLAENNAILFAEKIKEVVADMDKLYEVGKRANKDLCFSFDEINAKLNCYYQKVMGN